MMDQRLSNIRAFASVLTPDNWRDIRDHIEYQFAVLETHDPQDKHGEGVQAAIEGGEV